MAFTKPRSNVILYKTKIKASQNVYIDDMETYLIQCTSLGMQCQYIKHDLTLDIKVNLPEKTQSDCDWNYVKIQNIGLSSSDDETPCYYFLAGIVPVSQKACRLALAMDTVNTLGQSSDDICNPRNFDPRTSIQRQHGDRFLHPDGSLLSSGRLVRKIDEQPENLVISDKVVVSDTTLTNSDLDTNWYLIYKSGTDVAVTCDLICDDAIKIGTDSYEGGNVQLGPDDFQVGNYYYLTDVDNPGASFVFSGGSPSVTYDNPGESGYGTKAYVINRENINDNRIRFKKIEDNSIDANWTYKIWVNFTSAKFFRVSVDDSLLKYGSYGISQMLTSKSGIWAGNVPVLSTINEIDRTDSTITKILKYPYCPIPFVKSAGNRYTFDSSWEYRLGCMRYMGQGVPDLGNTTVTTFTLPEYRVSYNNISATDAKKIDNESKLYNSEFYTVKVQYDSFYKEIPLENNHCTRRLVTNTNPPGIDIDFKPTNTINSKFAFKLNTYGMSSTDYVEDYGKYIFSTRSNEETIFNNEYINYIKYGEQYDKKAASLQAQQNTASAIISGVGAAFNIVTGGISGIGAFKELRARGTYNKAVISNRQRDFDTAYGAYNASLVRGADGKFTSNNPELGTQMLQAGETLLGAKVQGTMGSAGQLAMGVINQTIAGIAGAAGAIINVSISKQLNENSLAQKKAQLQAQAATVAGTDDVDLLSYYADNKLHLIRYQARNYVINQLYRMFDLSGYAHVAQETPNVDSRIWYNYIQCSPVFKENKDNMKSTWIENLEARYEAGVTVLHHNVVNSSTTYDFDQQYENWESWLLNDMT